MPRAPKNPNNVITRLRQTMSTPNFNVTRKVFCERYGFPLDSITALERGTYRLNREMAQRISSATGISTGSLLLDQDPLRAWDGSPFTSKTCPPSKPMDEKATQSAYFLLRSAIRAAAQTKVRSKTRDRSAEFNIMLQEWLARAMHDLGAEEPFWRFLFGSWLEFEPTEATLHRFNPNVQHLSRTGAQLPPRSKIMETYLGLWNSRNELIKSAKVEVVCDVLPKESAALLRRFLEDYSAPASGRLDRTPAEVEKMITLQETASRELAKKNDIRYDETNPQPVDELLHRLALEKLAAEGRKLSS